MEQEELIAAGGFKGGGGGCKNTLNEVQGQNHTTFCILNTIYRHSKVI